MAAPTDVTPATGAEGPPVFYFDDCCPLCRGYTAVFAGLGLAGRQGFSTIEDGALCDLDFDRARHQIPLRDPASGRVDYGLDGILGLLADRYRWMGAIVRRRPVRRALDGFYWFVTYNRRHIVTAPPPSVGVDCAPDFRRSAVVVYLVFCGAVATALALVAGVGPVVAAAALAGLVLIGLRRPAWSINRYQALGHVGSIAVASAAVGALVLVASSAVSPEPWPSIAATVASAVTGARKLWLRRWMVLPRHSRRAKICSSVSGTVVATARPFCVTHCWSACR